LAFNSINFLLFFSTTTLIFYVVANRFKWIWLLLASVFFYITFIPVFIFLIASLIIINYFIAIWLNKEEKRKKNRVFIFAVLLNILILAFFKYFDFFRFSDHFVFFDFEILRIGEPLRQWVIPLGLSYFTFTILSYLIEVKRDNIQPERHLGIFSAYLLFFPKIAQGPIERPQNLIPQFRQPHELDYHQVVEGLNLMLWGFFKKLVVADRLAIYVNAVYGNSENHNGTTLAVATLFFAIQIYADFSGYTDIALGTAKILGFNLTNNFNRPYFSTSIKEFWSRWHISFSTWLRDYLFLPLAYFFSGKLKNERYLSIASEKWIYLFATMITFAICGLWHGEGLNYLVWGLLFGIYLTYANWTSLLSKKIRKRVHVLKSAWYYKTYKILLTFFLVSFAWVFFRATDLSTAFAIIDKIFTQHGKLYIADNSIFSYSLIAIILFFIMEFKIEFFPQKYFVFKNKNMFVKVIAYTLLIIYIGLFGVLDGGQFIYFKY
jgi:alginate O-acetyltransferase complex protein AlgI